MNSRNFDSSPVKNLSQKTTEKKQNTFKVSGKRKSISFATEHQDESTTKASMNIYQKSKQAQLSKFNNLDVCFEQVSKYATNPKSQLSDKLNQTFQEEITPKKYILLKEEFQKISKQVKTEDSIEKIKQDPIKTIKAVKQLQILQEKLIKAENDVQQLAQIREQNSLLREKLKIEINEKERMKEYIKNARKECIQQNFEADEGLKLTYDKLTYGEHRVNEVQEEVRLMENIVLRQEQILNEAIYEWEQIKVLLNNNTSDKSGTEKRIRELEGKTESIIGEISKLQENQEKFRVDFRKSIGLVKLKTTFKILKKKYCYQYFLKELKYISNKDKQYNIFRKVVFKVDSEITTSRIREGFLRWLQYTKKKQIMSQFIQNEVSEKINDYSLLKFFKLWRIRYLQNTQIHEKQQVAKEILACYLKIRVRYVNGAFQRWASAMKHQNKKEFKFFRLLFRNHKNQERAAFNIWQRIKKQTNNREELFQTHKRKKALRLMNKAFYYLKHGIVKQKQQNFLFKNTFYKKWRQAYLHCIFIREMDKTGINMNRGENNIRLKQFIFNSFKLNWITEKNQRLSINYKEKCKQVIDSSSKQISADEIIIKQRNGKIFKKVIFIMSNKRIFSYWNQWKQNVHNFKNFKHLTVWRKLKNYKLNQSFCYWKILTQKLNHHKQMKNITKYQNDSKNMLSQILAYKQNNSSKFQRFIEFAYEKSQQTSKNYQAKKAFIKWKKLSRIRSIQQHCIKKTVTRQHINNMRFYFDQYKREVNIRIRYYNGLKKYENVLAPMNNKKIMRKYYEILQQNRLKLLNLKQYIKRLVIRKDLDEYRLYFREWVNKTQRNKIFEIEYQYHQQAEIDYVVKSNIHNFQNQICSQKMIIGDCEIFTENVSRRLTKKYFLKMLHSQEHRGFKTWFDSTIKFRTYKNAIKGLINHKYQRDLRDSMTHWKGSLRKFRIRRMNTQHLSLQRKITARSMWIMEFCKEQEGIKNDMEQQIETYDKERSVYQRRLNYILDTFKYNKDNKCQIKKHYFVFKHWREYTKDKKNKLKRLTNFLQNYLLKSGFNPVKKIYTDHLNQHRQRRQRKFIKKFKKKFFSLPQRYFFSVWRQNIFMNSYIQKVQIKEELQEIYEQKVPEIQPESLINMQLMKNHLENKVCNLLKRWRDYVNKSKQIKPKIAIGKELFQYMRITSTLRRLNQFTKQRKRYRRNIDKIYLTKELHQKKEFYSILKFNYEQLKERQSKIRSSIHIFIAVQQKLAFLAIQDYSKFIKSKPLTNQQKGVLSLQRFYHKQDLLPMRQGLNAIKIQVNKIYIRQKVLKQILVRKCNGIRSFFNILLQNSITLKAQEEVLDSGLCQQQFSEYYQSFYNLTALALNNEHTKQQDLKQYLEQHRKIHYQVMLKSVIRWKLYNNEQYVLPKFFDMLRQYKDQQKQKKLKLKQVISSMSNRKQNKLQYAFQKWNKKIITSKQRLMKRTQDNLIDIYLSNQKKILQTELKAVKQVITCVSTDTELNMLKKQQKDARNVCLRILNKRIQQRQLQAFSKWISFAKKDKLVKDSQSVSSRYDLIIELKKKIDQLSIQNQQIQQENQIFERKALNGLELAPQIDILSQQRNDLTLQLADKALYMKKLVEENNNLNIRLSQQRLYSSQYKNTTGSSLNGLSNIKNNKSLQIL